MKLIKEINMSEPQRRMQDIVSGWINAIQANKSLVAKQPGALGPVTVQELTMELKNAQQFMVNLQGSPIDQVWAQMWDLVNNGARWTP